MSEAEPRELVIRCDACDTRATVDEDELAASLARHNANLHDGDAKAYVDAESIDQLGDGR